MKIAEVVQHLEAIAPLAYQESYDNAGLITGNAGWDCTAVLVTLDVTPAIVVEAVNSKCNLIVAHHPIVFGGLKKINGKNYVEQTVIAAIKNDIAIYAIHTNLDNVKRGVNGKIASLLNLQHTRILQPKENILRKLYTFVPTEYLEVVRASLFEAGAGHIGNYSECSFSASGEGTFKAGENTNPFVGNIGTRHTEPEVKIEVVFPGYLQNRIVQSLLKAHPYEEVAYDVVALSNAYTETGSGIVGELPAPVSEKEFLDILKEKFNLSVIRHTALKDVPVKKIAVCGGAGSFLIGAAIAAGADFYITADVKYHEFFDANDRVVIADIGHYESEQFTIDLLCSILQEKFINFAVLKSKVNTNPVRYFV